MCKFSIGLIGVKIHPRRCREFWYWVAHRAEWARDAAIRRAGAAMMEEPRGWRVKR